MPTGPKGQKRPADVIGNAVRVMRIATGEEADDVQAPANRADIARTRMRQGPDRADLIRSAALRPPENIVLEDGTHR